MCKTCQELIAAPYEENIPRVIICADTNKPIMVYQVDFEVVDRYVKLGLGSKEELVRMAYDYYKYQVRMHKHRDEEYLGNLFFTSDLELHFKRTLV